jgi:hypothetical protein
MKYINPLSRKGLVCRFSDYIISKLNEDSKGMIEVIDFRNIFVVSGVVDAKEPLDIRNISNEFYEKYKDLYKEERKAYSTIDLIEYKPFKTPNIISFDFNRSDRPLYKQAIINMVKNMPADNQAIDSIDYIDGLLLEINGIKPQWLNDRKTIYNQLSIKSEYPFGCSMNMGRMMMYKLEMVARKLFDSVPVDAITISYQFNENKLSVQSPSKKWDQTVSDIANDLFANMDFPEKEMNGYQIENDLDYPFILKPWLK